IPPTPPLGIPLHPRRPQFGVGLSDLQLRRSLALLAILAIPPTPPWGSHFNPDGRGLARRCAASRPLWHRHSCLCSLIPTRPCRAIPYHPTGSPDRAAFARAGVARHP